MSSYTPQDASGYNNAALNSLAVAPTSAHGDGALNEATELQSIIDHLQETLHLVEQDTKVLFDLLAIAVHLFRQVEEAAREERDPDQDESLSNHWILASVVFSLYKDRFQSAYGDVGTSLQALYDRVLEGMNSENSNLN